MLLLDWIGLVVRYHANLVDVKCGTALEYFDAGHIAVWHHYLHFDLVLKRHRRLHATTDNSVSPTTR